MTSSTRMSLHWHSFNLRNYCRDNNVFIYESMVGNVLMGIVILASLPLAVVATYSYALSGIGLTFNHRIYVAALIALTISSLLSVIIWQRLFRRVVVVVRKHDNRITLYRGWPLVLSVRERPLRDTVIEIRPVQLSGRRLGRFSGYVAIMHIGKREVAISCWKNRDRVLRYVHDLVARYDLDVQVQESERVYTHIM